MELAMSWLEGEEIPVRDLLDDECEIKAIVTDFGVEITPSFPDSEFQGMVSIDGNQVVTFDTIGKITISSTQGIIFDENDVWRAEITLNYIDFIAFHNWYVEFGVKT